jgi:hypothetical protein
VYRNRHRCETHMTRQWLLIALVLLPFIVSLKGSNFVWRFLSLFCCIVTVPFAVVSLLPQQHELSTNMVIAIWCLGALTWVIAWVFAGISLASKSRQQHG